MDVALSPEIPTDYHKEADTLISSHILDKLHDYADFIDLDPKHIQEERSSINIVKIGKKIGEEMLDVIGLTKSIGYAKARGLLEFRNFASVSWIGILLGIQRILA